MMEVFESNGIGKVNHVDLITKIGKDKKVYNSAYVHFDYWYDNIASKNIQEKLNAGKETKIVYDDPWFWKAYKNETKKFGGNGQRKERLVIEKEELQPVSLRRLTYEDIFEEPPKEQEFTQEDTEGFLFADLIEPFNMLIKTRNDDYQTVLCVEKICNPQDMFDLVNVKDGYRYYTNDILSHNCAHVE
ncbi:MAG: hypothetical protein EBS19_15410, partial [Spirochaetia bacterium]|nr:hypothetical protein [Spirochaetia bacterium]